LAKEKSCINTQLIAAIDYMIISVPQLAMLTLLPELSGSSVASRIMGGLVCSKSCTLTICLNESKTIAGSARIEAFLFLYEAIRTKSCKKEKPVYAMFVQKWWSLRGELIALN